MSLLRMGKGAAGVVPLLAKGAINYGANLAQPFAAAPVPGATTGFLPGRPFGERALAFLDALQFNLPSATEERAQRYQREALEDKFTPANISDYVTAYPKAIGATLFHDVLGGSEALTLGRGRTEAGETLTPEEVGQNAAMLGIKALPIAGLLSRVGALGPASRATAAARLAEEAAKVRTVGELEAAATAAGRRFTLPETLTPEEVAAARTRLRAERSGPPSPELDLEILERIRHTESPAFDVKTTEALTYQATTSQVYRRLALDSDFLRSNPDKSVQIAEAVRRGALTEDTVIRIADDYNLPLNQATEYIAEALKRTASGRGKGLQAFTEGINLVNETLMARALEGDTAAIRYLRDARTAARRARVGNSVYAQAAEFLRTAERAGLVGMLSQPKTFLRNLEVALVGVGPVKITSDLISGTLEAITGKAIGSPRPMRSYYADLMGDLGAVVDVFSPAGRHKLAQVIDALPETKRTLTRASGYDIDTGILSDLATYWRTWGERGARPESFADAAGLLRDVLTLGNHAQEVFMRRIFFDARLRANIERSGMTLDNLLRHSLAPEKLPAELAGHVAEATQYALKKTFSAPPDAQLLRSILNTYRQVPGMTVLFPPFPRFLMNQWSYLTDHSPMGFLDLLSKDFRDALFKGADDGFVHREAARKLGQAITGTMLLSAAYQLRTSDYAGPKYYQFKTGVDEKGQNVYVNILSDQPFTTLAGLGEIVKFLQEGRSLSEMNLDAGEWSELLAGIRRPGELGALALVDIVRATQSDDPDTLGRAVASVLGQTISRYFVPFKAFGLDIQGLAGDKAAQTYREVRGQEWVGPAIQQIPNLEGLKSIGIPTSESLPPRIDPFTGQAHTVSSPAVMRGGVNVKPGLAYSGIILRSQTKFQDLVESTPGLQQQELIGNYGSQEANSLVAQNFGRFLSAPSEGDPKKTIGDVIAENVKAMRLTPKGQRWALQAFAKFFRQPIAEISEEQYPQAFLKKKIVSQELPSSVERLLIERLSNALRGVPESGR